MSEVVNMHPHDPMLALLSSTLQDQIETNREGFQRLETAVVDSAQSAQRDMRMFTLILLLGLLATVGVNLTARWAGYEVSATQVQLPDTRESVNTVMLEEKEDG